MVSIFSCVGQEKNNSSSKDAEELNSEWLFLKHDFDSYFAETTYIKSKNGPNNITRNIIQDRKGYYWLATWEGIVGYDGTIFTNFTNKEKLRRFRVFSILEDESGNIWFGTVGAGIYLYDGKTFINFTMDDGLVHNDVYCIYEDSKGIIWFGTKGGVSSYNGKTFINYTTTNGLIDDDVNSIIEDETGKLWFGTRGQAFIFDGKTFTRLENSKGLPFTNVRSIIKDSKDNIWLGGNGGLWKFDNGNYLNITTDFVGYIYEDKNENIWTSSQSAYSKNTWVLTKYSNGALSGGDVKGDEIFSDDNMFFGIWEDTKEGIWFGTLNGILCYSGDAVKSFKAVKD